MNQFVETIIDREKILGELKKLVLTTDGRGTKAKAKILLDLIDNNGIVPVYEMIKQIAE